MTKPTAPTAPKAAISLSRIRHEARSRSRSVGVVVFSMMSAESTWVLHDTRAVWARVERTTWVAITLLRRGRLHRTAGGRHGRSGPAGSDDPSGCDRAGTVRANSRRIGRRRRGARRG